MKFLVPLYLGSTLQAFWPAPPLLVLALFIGTAAWWVAQNTAFTRKAHQNVEEN